MPVKINISKSAVLAKVMSEFTDTLPELSEEILNSCNQYCKEDTGTLIASSYVHSVPSEGKLIWQTPYARRQYWEIKTAYQTPNSEARWRWCEYAKRHHKADWEKSAQKLMEGR